MSERAIFENAVEFYGIRSDVVVTRIDDAIDIRLIATAHDHRHPDDVFPGQPVGTATVRLHGVTAPADAVFIKAYSENTGVVDVLVSAGVIEPASAHLDIFGGVPRRIDSPEHADAYVAVASLTDRVIELLDHQRSSPGL